MPARLLVPSLDYRVFAPRQPDRDERPSQNGVRRTYRPPGNRFIFGTAHKFTCLFVGGMLTT
jgi:hypothetical protein